MFATIGALVIVALVNYSLDLAGHSTAHPLVRYPAIACLLGLACSLALAMFVL